MRQPVNRFAFFMSAFAVAIILLLAVTPVMAQGGAFTELQVLLPGESAAPGSGSGKTGSPITQTVGVPFTITVRAVDDTWNTVTSVTDAVTLSSSDASASLPGTFNLIAGLSNVQVRLNAVGSFTISADDQSDPTIPLSTSASVNSLLLQGFVFDRISQKNQYAGQSMSITITAVDPGGQPVNNYTGQVNLQELTSYGDGRISPSTVTFANGTWSGNVTLYRADETSINRGNVNIYAFLANDASVNGTSDPFTVHPGNFTRVHVVVPGQDPWPGSVSGVTGTPASQAAAQPFSVDLYATDNYWNPLPSGDNVRITSSDPSFTPVNRVLSNGYAAATVTLNTVGTQTLTISDQTNGSIQGMTSAGIMVIPSAPDHFEVNTVASPQTAGVPVAVTIRATDAGGNTIPDYSGSAVIAANTGPRSITPELIAFTAGVWTGNMTFRGAGGAVAFTVADFSSPPHIGTSSSFQVSPGPYTGLQVILPGQTPQGGTVSGVSGTPSIQSAGTSFNMTVRAVDQYWNRVTGINARVGLSSTDAFAGMPTEITLNNGELVQSVTLYRAGFQTITASDLDAPSITAHTSNQVEVVGGPYSRMVLLAPGETIAPGTVEGRTGAATDQSINFSFTVQVRAADAWFNPVSGPTDVMRLTSNDPLAQLPSDQNMTDGLCLMDIRLSTGGFQQITASNITQPGMPVSTTQVRAISSGFHLEAEISPTTVAAGGQFNLTVKVTNDAGSVIQEVNAAVSVQVQNASTQAPGRGTLLNTQFQLLQGQRTIAQTYTYAEPIVLVVSDDQGSVPAVSEVITVVPGAPTAVRLSSNPSWVAGNRHATVSARVVDAYENGVPDQPVVFSLLSGLANLTQVDSLTSATGDATADFHGPRQPDTSRLRAVSNGLSAELDVETALVDPTKPGGYVTNYPNPFHPGEAPTTIAYKISDNATVTLKIFTLSGGLVLEKQFMPGTVGGTVGLNEYKWDGRNGDGMVVASGGYIVFIQADGNGETLNTMRRKIAVVR